MNFSSETNQAIKKDGISEEERPSRDSEKQNSYIRIHNMNEAQNLNEVEEREYKHPHQNKKNHQSYTDKVQSFDAIVWSSNDTLDIADQNYAIQELFKQVSIPQEIHILSDNGKSLNESALKRIEDFNRQLNPKFRKKYKLPPDFIPIEDLGYGSYGKVFKVFDKANRRFLAAKRPLELLENASSDDKSSDKEYKALMKLSKYKNSKLLEVVMPEDESEKPFYVLMECGSGNLHDFCRFRRERGLKWSDEDLVELFYELCDQINELREIKICHRDIKPENIIMSSLGIFKLTDFGFAEEVDVNVEQELPIAGTEGYWAPEIAEAKRLNRKTCKILPYKADLFSIKRTINDIMKDDGRKDTIEKLVHLKERPQKTLLSEGLLREYKNFLFDEFYHKASSFQEKFEKLQIFTEYCAFGEISKWLDHKLKYLKDDNQSEARLINFFAGQVLDINGYHNEAFEHLMACENLSQGIHDKLTASLFNTIGITKYHLCSFESARNYQQKGLEIKKNLFGKSSPEVAEEIMCLAGTEFTLGNREIAFRLFQKALKIYEKEPASITNNTVNRLAFLAIGFGFYDDAIQVIEKILASTRGNRGERHPTVALILMCLGVAYHRLGMTEDALAALRESLKIHKETISEDHQHMTYFWFHCGEAFKEAGDFEKAKSYFGKSLKLLEDKYKQKPLIFVVKIFLAELLIQENEDLNKAEEYLKQCQESLQKIDNSDYYYIGVFWRALGLLHEKKKEYSEALEQYQTILKWFKKLSPENIWIASILIRIGIVNSFLEDYEQALSALQEAHSILNKKLSWSHNLFVMCSYNLGKVYFEQKAFLRARTNFLEALKMRSSLKELGYPNSFPKSEDIKNYLDKINSDLSLNDTSTSP